MLKNFVTSLLLVSSSLPVYFVPYSSRTSECQSAIGSESLTLCPQNLNARRPTEALSDFLDRELVEGIQFEEQYPDCAKVSGHILLCERK